MTARPVLRLLLPLLVVVALVVGALMVFQAGERQGQASVADGPGTAADPGHLKAQPIDTGFAADMIDHHAQAVQMSLLVIDRATTPEVRTHAIEIATSQRREEGRLIQFLADRGIDQTDPTRTVMAWMQQPMPHDQMPGLATAAEMVELTNAEGADIDRIFVRLMIRHHEGGVHMAEFAAKWAETQDLRELAGRMVVEQQQELNELRPLEGP